MTSTPQFSTSPHPYTKMPVPPKLAKFSTAQTSSVLKISPLQPSSISTSTAPLPQHLKLSLSENENLIPQPPVRKLVCYRAYPNKEKPCGNLAKEMFFRFFGTIKEILRTILFNVLFGGLSLIVIFIYQIMKTLVITTTDVFWGVTLQILALFPGKSLPARFWSLKRAKAGYEGNYEKASKCRPYFPNAKDNKPLTLVLDLDETLIHSTRSLPIHGTFDSLEIIKTDGLPQKVYLRKRPYLSEFLEKVGSEFNIVIFTASRQEYADVILDFVDPKNIISRRLYRESCIKTETGFFKDLTKVGQDLSKIILLDNSLVAGSLQPENYLPIKSWFHDEADKFLLHYTNFFLECAKKWKSDSSATKDIRKYLKTYLYQGKHQIKEDTVPAH